MNLKLLVSCLILLSATACRGRPWKQKLLYAHFPTAIYLEEKNVEGSSPPPSYSHPPQLPEGKLRLLLENLQYSTWGLFKGSRVEPVFADGELESLIGPLTAALKDVKPQERIRFLVSRTAWTVLGAKGVSGVVFFTQPRQVNVAFDLLNERLTEDSGDPRGMVFHGDPVEITGKKPEILPPEGADLKRDEKGTLHPRWVVADLAEFTITEKPPPSPAPGEPVSPPAVKERPPEPAASEEVEEIKRRLENLKKLRDAGTITEEEYQKVRQEILLQKED